MVALLVGLKLRLLRNSLRRSPWQVLGLVLGALYALGVVLLVVGGLVALRFADTRVAADVTTVAFTVLTVGWLVLSLLVFGVDETVDPARFALLPLRASQLVPGLAAAALLGLPGLATCLVALGLLGTWSIGLVPLLGAVLAIVLGVALCVLWSRAATAVLARALASRRTRDAAVVISMGLVVTLALSGNLVGPALGSQESQTLTALLHRAGTVAGWTPFGWVWAVPGLLAEGQWGDAALRVLLSLALAAALVLTWTAALRNNLTSPATGVAQTRGVSRTSWLPRLYPRSPAGAVAVRCLRYWRRDPRYVTALAGMLILPVFILVTGLVSAGGGTVLIAFAPLAAALTAPLTLALDLAYDGSALSLHVVSGISGAHDRAGRVMAAATLVVPLLGGSLVGCAALSGRWDLLPVTVALSTALLLSGLGAAMGVSTLLPGRAAPPGSNPFAGNTSGGLQTLANNVVTFLVMVAGALPTLVLAIGSLWAGWLAWVALLVGLALGATTLSLGIRLGGARLERRWPEIVAEVSDTR